MSYGLYIGKDLTIDAHAWLAGYGDEPSSHWLEVMRRQTHSAGAVISVGVGPEADLPGHRTEIPQAQQTALHIRVSYSYYKGAPAPLTNGGLNEFGVAVRDIWSESRPELIAMTPANQTGLNYSDLARAALEQARTARDGVLLMGQLIAQYGEASYGGNSHIIADTNEAWVVIQFAGGQGLWCAERLGPTSIRASRPGYIHLIPVDEPDHPDFLYSPNFVSFAQDQNWYRSGAFDVNIVYGDSKGRWEGVRWIEGEMTKRAGAITLQDMIWAIRTSKLTGDTAGYGQVVPLVDPSHTNLRMLWHAPIGAVAAPVAPVFMGQTNVPEEFQAHRYLTLGESHRFQDNRKAVTDGAETVSFVRQGVEASRSAVAECKRLLYLMLHDANKYLPMVTRTFTDHEMTLARDLTAMVKTQGPLVSADDLTCFSDTALRDGLGLAMRLADKIESDIRANGGFHTDISPRRFDQLW